MEKTYSSCSEFSTRPTWWYSIKNYDKEPTSLFLIHTHRIPNIKIIKGIFFFTNYAFTI